MLIYRKEYAYTLFYEVIVYIGSLMTILKSKGADTLEIYDKKEKGYIEVWLTNQEQQMYDRKKITENLLSKVDTKKCKVVFFLSGKGELYRNTENLLIQNLGCV